MDILLLYPIAIPILVGLVCLITPKRVKIIHEALIIITTLGSVGLSIFIFLQPDLSLAIPWLQLTSSLTIGFDIRLSFFARLILVAASIFSLLIGLYSVPFMATHKRRNEYYAYFLMVLGMTAGATLADNLVLLLLFWELHGLLLFLMAGLNGNEAVPATSRTLIIAGVGDLSLLLGIGLLWLQTGSLSIQELVASPVVLNGWMPILAFLLMSVGAFAKAGAIPLHSWIPAIAPTTPTPIMAYLPASLDKLLGIYLLARIAMNFYVMSLAMGMVLMTFGAITILGAVLMALIQSDYRKMLSYHAVSQVGYMVIGIGTGVPVGVLGGLFHMINHATYKCCLFLCGGSVQNQTGRAKFSELGGLASAMPWTFAGCLIAAMAISGVPPMNGFVSKWLVYQGIIERGGAAFPIFLLVAMFGSALTLASFMKLLYSMFWGDKPEGLEEIKESPWTMTLPIVFLAFVAVVFGIFYSWPLNTLLAPILGQQEFVASFGLWQANLAIILMLVSLMAGLIIYWAGRPRQMMHRPVFIGGETVEPGFVRVPGTHFYGPVKAMRGLSRGYALAEAGALDVYMLFSNFIRRASEWIYKYIDQALADFYQEIIPAILSLVGQILRVLNARMILTRLLWIFYALGLIGILLFPGQVEITALTRLAACIGMIGWAFLAWVEDDLSHMLILAATSQVGFVVLGATISLEVAFSYLLTGSVALFVLFWVSLTIKRRLHTDLIDEMGGLASRMPLVFILFVIAALWLAGLPPFGNFFSKFLLGVAAGEISPFLTVAITGAAILTLSYLLRPIRRFLRTG